MVQDEVLKLKFDNSCGGKLFATQNDTGRILTVQILSDKNNVVDVTGMSLRLYIGNQKEVAYCDGEIIDAEKGKFKLQLFNSQLKYPGIQQAQFILKKDDRKIGSKIFDIHIEEGVEAGSSMGVNLVIMYDEIKEAAEFLKGYDKTLEEAKKVDSSLKIGIKEGKGIREDISNYKEAATEVKNDLENTTKKVQDILNEAVSFKDDVESIKNTLAEENTKANSNLTNLSSKIAETEETANNLENKISIAKTTKSELEETGSLAENIKQSLEVATTDANTIKLELGSLKNQGDALSKDLTKKIDDGKNLKSSFDASMDNANSAKTILDESVKNAADTNATLIETDDKAKNTETLIKNLMNQLEKTKTEVEQIIASGDLSKYVTDPKLQDVLKNYATKNELPTKLADLQEDDMHKIVTGSDKYRWDNKIDKSQITDEYYGQSQDKIVSQKGITALANEFGQELSSVYSLISQVPSKEEIPTNISQLINDKTFKTEAEIQQMIEKASSLKKEVVTSLPQAGKDDVIYLVKDAKGKDNNNYLEYLWLNGKYELIGSTQVDLSGYAQLTDITASKVISIYELDKDFQDALKNDQDFLTAISRDMFTLVAFKGFHAEDLMGAAGFETALYYKGQIVGAVEIVGNAYDGMDKAIREDKMPKEGSITNWNVLSTYNSTIQAQLKEQKESALDKTTDKAIAPQGDDLSAWGWKDDDKYVTPLFMSTYVNKWTEAFANIMQEDVDKKLNKSDIQEFTQQELEEAFK